MYCKHCGKEVEKGDTFCPFCGEKILSEEKVNANPPKTKLLIAIGIVAVLVIAVAGFMAFNHSRTISIDAFALSTEPVYEGYNGEGEIVNDITLNDDAASKLINEVKENRREDLQAFLATVSFVAEPTKDLSNEDKIHVTALYDEDLAKEKHINVVKKMGDYTVSGLEEKPKDLTAADIKDSGIVDVVWSKEYYIDYDYDVAYFGTNEDGEHKIFYISHDDLETDDGDTTAFYSIENTNGFTTDTNKLRLETDEIYGRAPIGSLDQCLEMIKDEGYTLERL